MILFILIALLSGILQYFLPWWIAGLVAFVLAALLGKSGGKSFLAGFGAVFLLWLVMALVSHLSGGGIMTQKMTEVFKSSLSFLSVPLLIFITALIGGLTGGFSATAGFHTASIFKKTALQEKKKAY
ncbi:MAG: hypothetical protein H7Y04_02230 [Verrucomicrobia bacterium]|nr:hypothetical protein [Cytophagales bacterium]